jgi:methionyl-tRNA formyltransferase
MKTIFLGTPALAVPFLERLAQKTDVRTVITAPDQPAGRGYELKAPEVKVAAQKLSLPVLQPETLKDAAAVEKIRALGADVGIVVAYGKLLPKEVLSLLKHGFLNVHFSLLPKYRGAAPIQWALVNGETETGVTLFWLDEGMDTGPIFLQKKIAIQPEDDADSLRNKLVELGVSSLEEALQLLEKSKPRRDPQTGPASKAPILKKENGRIDWAKPAEAIQNQVRGFAPWPGAYVEGLKIVKAKVSFDSEKAAPGTVIRLVSGEGPVVKCGSNSLVLLQVQPEGKKAMPAWSWWQGARLKLGEKLR